MSGNKKQSKKHKQPTEKALEVISMKQAKSDPQGSYTGVCKAKEEEPVQDADDL